ncbi:hypothetical protein N9N67_09020 [Bacteriovoracaceae bacterium]|nr:hypothetical protein [Bacteriovoracaceae bacterium]
MRVITTKNKRLKQLIEDGYVCIITTADKLTVSMTSVLASFEINPSHIYPFKDYEQAHHWIISNLDKLKLIIGDYEIHGVYAVNFFKDLKKRGDFPRVESVICRNKYQDEIVRKSNLNKIPTICSPYRPNKFIQKIFEAADDLIYPSSLTICFQLISSNIKNGNYFRAREICLDTLKKEPNFVPGYFYLGKINTHLKDYPVAISNFEMGLKLAGNNLFCLEGLFTVYELTNNTEKALSTITKICLIYPLSGKRINQYLNLVLKIKDFKELLVLEKIINFQKKKRTTFIYEKKFQAQPFNRNLHSISSKNHIIGPTHNVIQEFESFVGAIDSPLTPEPVITAEYQEKPDSTKTVKQKIKTKNFDRKLGDFTFYQSAISNSDKISSLKILHEQFLEQGNTEIPYKVLYQIEKIYTHPKNDQAKIDKIFILEEMLTEHLQNKSLAKGTRLRLQNDGILGETPSLEKTREKGLRPNGKALSKLTPRLAEEVRDAMEKENKVIIQTEEDTYIGRFKRIEDEKIVLKNDHDVSIVFQSPFSIKNIRPIDEERYPSLSALQVKLPQLYEDEVKLLLEDEFLEVFYIDKIYDGKYRGFQENSLIIENVSGTLFKLEKPKFIKNIRKKITRPFQYSTDTKKRELIHNVSPEVSEQMMSEQSPPPELTTTKTNDFTLSNIHIPYDKLVDTRTDLSSFEEKTHKYPDFTKTTVQTTSLSLLPDYVEELDQGIIPSHAILIEKTSYSRILKLDQETYLMLVNNNLLNIFDKYLLSLKEMKSCGFNTINLKTKFRKLNDNTYYLLSYLPNNVQLGSRFLNLALNERPDLPFVKKTKFNRIKNKFFYDIKEFLNHLGIYLDTSVDNYWFIESSQNELMHLLDQPNDEVLKYLKRKITFSLPISYRESPPPVLPNADELMESPNQKSINS